MNVSNSTVGLNSYVNNQKPQNPKELSQEQREVITDVAAYKTTQDKVEIYAKGTQNANEINDKATGESNSNSTEAYVDFSKDVQQSNNLNTAVNNGADFSNIFKAEEATPLSSLQQSVQNFNDIKADVQRSENINTYAQNSNYLY